MAKTDSTKGKGAKDDEAKRATSGASPAKSPAKKTASTTASKTSARSSTGGAAGGAGGGGGGTAAETGTTAKKATTRRAAGAGGAGEGGATAKTAGKSTRSGGAASGAGSAGAGAATGGSSRKTGGARGGGGGAGGGGLQADLREFVSSRPKGWGHDDWLGLLDDLRGRGHDVSDTAAVGMALERERLAATLEGVEGLSAAEAGRLVDRYQTLWSLRQAGVDQIADTAGVPLPLGERIKQAVG